MQELDSRRLYGSDPELDFLSMPERSGEPATVNAEDLERELAALRRSAAGEVAGIFGPASAAWRINRESAVFLAAGRALLMQLAHPWVAAAIAQHSRTLDDPIGRFHRTFGVVYTMVFGTTDQASTAARRLHRRHQGVAGTLAETAGAFAAGSAYRANDLAALRWVFATLVESAVIGYELINPPLSGAERDGYYRDSCRFAALFGIPQTALPRGWTDFARYIDRMLAGDAIAVGGDALAIAAGLFGGAAGRGPVPLWYRALTANILPQSLRDGFGLNGGARQSRAARGALFTLRHLYPHLPPRLRYVAPYHEACARITGRPSGRATRWLNRVWIGRDSLAG